MESKENVHEDHISVPNPTTYYPDFSRKLVCVQYPAIVNNVERSLTTLGGMSGLETAVGSTSKKLELRFHPKNIYNKPCIADRDYKPGILLKIRIRKPKAEEQNVAGPSRISADMEATVTGYEVIGVTAMTFKFNRLCDFQKLPLVPANGQQEQKESPLKYIYNKIIPDTLPDIKWLLSEESRAMVCFLPPTTFSRYNYSCNKLQFDKTDIYNSTMRPELGEQMAQFEKRSEARRAKSGDADVSQKVSIIRNSRRSRKAYSVTASFSDEVPKEPAERVLSLLRLDIVRDVPIERIKELFEERPIWSKVAIAYKTGVNFRLLKYVLPSVAYYYMSGPWRVMWVRYGYDPKKDSSSRIYQTFDFRVRDVDTSILHTKCGMSTVRAPKTDQKFSLKDNLEKRITQSIEIKENFFILSPGVIPPCRQIFYQLCDVLLPEVQNMLTRLPEVPPGKPCNPKTGWLPDHFLEQCREIANKYVQQKAKEIMIEERDKLLLSKASNVTDIEEVASTSATEDRIIIDDDSDIEMSAKEEDDEENIIEDAEWNDDDDDDDEEDEIAEIDMEAVEEVNKILESSESQKLEDFHTEAETIEAFAEMLRNENH